MGRNRVKRVICALFLLLAALMLCMPAMAYTGEAWLNTDIDGAVTADTPVARPQDDFNLAVNRDYISSLEIPQGNTGAGGFNDVRLLINQMRLDAIRDDALTGHDAQLVRRYYDMLMDWDSRDGLGVSPAQPYLNQLRAIDSLDAMTAWFADRERGGIAAFSSDEDSRGSTGCLFGYGVAVSSDDPGARLWAVKTVKSTEISRAKTNEHPLSYLRTNVTVAQFDEFQKTYDVRQGDGMYVAPEDRICVW